MVKTLNTSCSTKYVDWVTGFFHDCLCTCADNPFFFFFFERNCEKQTMDGFSFLEISCTEFVSYMFEMMHFTCFILSLAVECPRENVIGLDPIPDSKIKQAV